MSSKRTALVLFSLMMLAVDATYSAVDQFLKIKGIKGESVDVDHSDEIDVISWDWSVEQKGSFGGRIRLSTGNLFDTQAIAFTKFIDKATPDLLLACVTGRVIPEAILTVRKVGVVPLEYLILILTDVRIISVSTGGAGDDDRLSEKVTLGFREAHIIYTEQLPDGSAGEVNEVTLEFFPGRYR